jgi:hypothetical protein
MGKRYLLCKCGSGSERIVIDCFTASCMAEANQAVKWFKEHHPERRELSIGPGEFFELLEEGHCSQEEWEAGLAELERRAEKST